MGICCIILSFAVFAQNGAETYEFRHGDDVYFGTVTELADGVMVRFNEDAPWKTNPMSGSYRREQVEYFRESSTNRARRHKEGWESRGFVNAGRSDDAPYWVPREEFERAERAMAMVAELGVAEPPAPPGITPDGLIEAEAEAAGGAAAQYLPHAILVLVGLALVGLVTRLLILPG
jgi:hypothetical protein